MCRFGLKLCGEGHPHTRCSDDSAYGTCNEEQQLSRADGILNKNTPFRGACLFAVNCKRNAVIYPQKNQEHRQHHRNRPLNWACFGLCIRELVVLNTLATQIVDKEVQSAWQVSNLNHSKHPLFSAIFVHVIGALILTFSSRKKLAKTP